MIKLLLRWKAASKRTRAPLAAAITAAALGLGSVFLAGAPAASASQSAAVAPRAPAASVKATLTQGLDTLAFLAWNPGDGLVGNTWWQAGVAASTIETYAQTTKDQSYDNLFEQAFQIVPTAAPWENSFDDDTAWWGLAWLQGYQITHKSYYLKNAEALANYIDQDWSSACGGGVWWERAHTKFLFKHVPNTAKNAIANELFLELTAWLASTYETIPGDTALATKYLNEAEAEWKWFQKVGMISNGRAYHYKGKTTANSVPAGLVSDGIVNPQYNGGACSDGGIAADLFTYNQGVILAGLAELYKAARNDPKDTQYRAAAPGYLTQAENIAKTVLNSNVRFNVRVKPADGKPPYTLTTSFTQNGVLTEPTCQQSEHCGTGNEGAFKGIFARDFKMLDDEIASVPKYNRGKACTATYNKTKFSQCTAMYNSFFTVQAKSIVAHDTSHVYPFYYFGMFWTGQRNPNLVVVTQVSALEALVASLDLPTPSSS